jgi:hypothetical protein
VLRSEAGRISRAASVGWWVIPRPRISPILSPSSRGAVGG